jgi:hypothetical protein
MTLDKNLPSTENTVPTAKSSLFKLRPTEKALHSIDDIQEQSVKKKVEYIAQIQVIWKKPFFWILDLSRRRIVSRYQH